MEDFCAQINETREGEPLSPEFIKAIMDQDGDYRFISGEVVDDIGVQFVILFKNNLGASIVVLDQPESDYTNLELAVIRSNPKETTWLPYPENGITDKTGLARNLTPSDVRTILEQIKGLQA